MQISYLTFGCKLNQAETDSLRRALENFGYQTVDFDSGENVFPLPSLPPFECFFQRQSGELIYPMYPVARKTRSTGSWRHAFESPNRLALVVRDALVLAHQPALPRGSRCQPPELPR